MNLPTAGQLRARVQVQRIAGQANDGGVVKSTWAALGDPFAARLTPLRGGEESLGARAAGRALFEIAAASCVALRAVTCDDRLLIVRAGGLAGLLDGAVMDLKDISNPDQRDRWLYFLCEKGVGDGQ